MKRGISELNDGELRKLFRAKEEFHRDMAKLPFEEKIKIVVKPQKIAMDASAAAGNDKTGKRVWEV